MPDLLIELFSEEIPAGMQARAAADLKRLMTDGLVEAGLTYVHAGAFHTPRRLVLAVEGLLAQSPDRREERKGPRTDAPEKALEGFLRSVGLTRDDLEARDDKKGQVWFAVVEKPGRPAAEIVAEVLDRVIRTFPWPKSMRWGAGSLRWVRPLQSILCLLSDEAGASVVPLKVDGIEAGNTTRGHRFMAPDRFAVTSFDDYEAKLKRARVLLRADERADHIWTDAHNRAFAVGMEVVEDAGLLAEVAGLVEWPVVLLGDIGDRFLDLPPEVLQTSMRAHQKFFSVRNPANGRIEKFVTVANIETQDEGATILEGNAKVLAARLSDAKFFWENDLRVAQAGMQPWLDKLADVTFHAKLGSQADRIARIAALAREIAPLVGADTDMAEQAARVAKADLASEMVYEFPELQGTMGKYYALKAGMPAAVAEAAEMHYKPLGPSDEVPGEPVSVAVALADKIDTLIGFWAIDEKPTGSKDPYALRRAALGVIRLGLAGLYRVKLSDLLVAHRFHVFRGLIQRLLPNEFLEIELLYPVDVDGEQVERSFNFPQIPSENVANWVVESAADNGFWRTGFTISLTMDLSQRRRIDWGAIDTDDIERLDEKLERIEVAPFNVDYEISLLAFFHDRLKVHLKDEGIRHDVIDACLAMPNNDDLTLLVHRARALSAFLKTDDGTNLLQGFKRANNILTQAEQQDGVEYSFGADEKFAQDPAEKALFAALDTADKIIQPAMNDEDFETAMQAMADLRAPIDAFFDAVQVNADNQTLRRNRLNLLHRIRGICLSVADLTMVEG